jgi:hypothetical protein
MSPKYKKAKGRIELPKKDYEPFVKPFLCLK